MMAVVVSAASLTKPSQAQDANATLMSPTKTTTIMRYSKKYSGFLPSNNSVLRTDILQVVPGDAQAESHGAVRILYKDEDNVYVAAKNLKPTPEKIVRIIKNLASDGRSGGKTSGGWRKSALGSACEVWENKGPEAGFFAWEGGCQDGRAQGRGVLSSVTLNGGIYEATIYQGHMEAGKKSGEGATILKNGDVHKGTYANNSFHGKGQYKWHGSLRQYKGEFRYGEVMGLGMIARRNPTDKNQIIRLDEGYFVAGKLHGKGKRTLPTRVFEGDFVRGQLDGRGKVSDRSGNVIFDGRWVNGRWASGKQYKNGRLAYEGRFNHEEFKGTHLRVGCGVTYDTSGRAQHTSYDDDGELWGKHDSREDCILAVLDMSSAYGLTQEEMFEGVRLRQQKKENQ